MDGLPTATGWQMKPQGGGPDEVVRAAAAGQA